MEQFDPPEGILLMDIQEVKELTDTIAELLRENKRLAKNLSIAVNAIEEVLSSGDYADNSAASIILYDAVSREKSE